MTQKKSINVLLVDQAVTFGGSIVVLSNIVNNMSEGIRCSVLYEVQNLIAEFLINDNIIKHRVPTLINYHSAGRIDSKLNSIRNKILRVFFKKLLLIGKYISSVLQILRIMRIIIQYRIDVIHSNNSREAVTAAIILRKKIVLHLHGVWADHSDYMRKKIDVFVSISEFIKNRMVDKGYNKDKIIVIPNPVINKSIDVVKLASYREKFDIAESDKVFGVVGRIVGWKGQLEFLEAASIVMQKMSGVKALIIGDISDGSTEYLDQIESRIKELGLQDRVIITGYIEDIHNATAMLDVLVHCSIKPEPFGLVITEAMVLGIPVIGSNIGAPSEIIKEGSTGYIVDPNDSKKMSSRLIEILSNDDLAQELGGNGRKEALDNYNITSYISRISDVYNNIC